MQTKNLKDKTKLTAEEFLLLAIFGDDPADSDKKDDDVSIKDWCSKCHIN